MRPLPRLAAASVAVALLVAGAAACTHETGSRDAFCREIKKAPPLSAVIEGFHDADPDEMTARLESARASYAALADAAPKEIDADVDHIVGLVDEILDVVGKYPDDSTALGKDIRTYLKAHPDVAASTTTVGQYTEDNCHVRLDGDLTSESTTTVTGPAATTTTTTG